MGTSGNVFVKSAVILIFLGVLTVNGYENDDIVFDQDGKNLAIEVPLIEEQHDQSFLQRLKRGLFDFWITPTTTLSPTAKTADGENETTQPSYDQTEGADVILNTLMNEPKKRTSRESGEENSVDQTSPKVEDNDIGNAAPGYPLPIYPTTDDEDLEGSGDVEGSAGDEDLWGNAGTEVPVRPSGQPQYYRITLKVIEPYKREYSDRHSKEYQELSGNVTKVIEELYRQKIPNFEHSANVVMISPLPDPFSTQVTIDVGSMFDDGFSDELEIRQILEKQLQLHSLGSLQVGPDGFTFRKVQAAGGPECDENSEMRCRDGTCIPLSQRCDGIPQCHDYSDELDCPKETTTEISGRQGAKEDEEDDDNYTPSRTHHSFNTLRPFIDSDNKVKCRGDDFPLPCHDGSRQICSVQKCDGIQDCDDGSDEEGCNSSGCGDGEFACDVTRCILESKRCDFTEDCKDGSDEHSCSYPACTPSEFKCRNSQCVTGSLRCNGVADCRDGSDEINCPCKVDQFECTPLFCIPLDKRCDGINDCSNQRDEKDCDSNPRCRDGEFTCDDGNCVSLRLRCDGHSDCSDRSDERNCTVITCNSNQFRCQDGTCLDIERRCDNYPDCNNGEDELQCGGAECGPSEFSCNDGYCIPYRLQCNGVKDCRDGSDERDCVKGKTGRQDVLDAGRHDLQNGLLTTVGPKIQTGKHKNRRQDFRVARRQGKKIKHLGGRQNKRINNDYLIRRNMTAKRFEIPSAGQIGDPIITAFPELKSEFEKRTNIHDSSEENSPNKEWEIIDHAKILANKVLLSPLNHGNLKQISTGTEKEANLQQNKKIKNNNSIKTNVIAKGFEIPSAGKIGDPIIAAFPELKSEFEKRTNIHDSSEENSPNKEWEIIDHAKILANKVLLSPLNHGNLKQISTGTEKEANLQQNKKIKNNNSIKTNMLAKGFEIPSAGIIGDPIIAAFPELESEFEKRTQTSSTSEKYSPNKDWEIINTDDKKNLGSKPRRSSFNHGNPNHLLKGTRNVVKILPDYDKLNVNDNAKDAHKNVNVHDKTTTLETPAPMENEHEDHKIRHFSDSSLDRMTQTKNPLALKANILYTVLKNHSTWDDSANIMAFGTTMHSVIANTFKNKMSPPIKAEIRIVRNRKNNEVGIDKVFADAQKIDDPVNLAYPELGLDTEYYYEGQYDEDDTLNDISVDDSDEYVRPYEDEEDYEDNRFNQTLSIDIETSKNVSSKPKNESEFTMTQQKWNLTTQLPILLETVGTVQTKLSAKIIRPSLTSKFHGPTKNSVWDMYKKKWGITKKTLEANTENPRLNNPKKDVEIISNHTLFNISSNSQGKLYRYTKDVKVLDPFDVVNKILESKRTAASSTSGPPQTIQTKGKSYRDYMKMLHEEKASATSNEKQKTLSLSATEPTTRMNLKSSRNTVKDFETNNRSIKSDEEIIPSKTYSIFTTEKYAETIKDSKAIFEKPMDTFTKKNKGTNKRNNKADRTNNENKGRKKGTVDWKNFKVTKKPDLYKNLKVESGLYIKKGVRVNLPQRLEFDNVAEQTKNKTDFETTFAETLNNDHGPEYCAKCALYWKKKNVESIANKSEKNNKTKQFSSGNDNNQNVDSGLDVSSENCTEFDSKTNSTSDGPQDSESREIIIATSECHDKKTGVTNKKKVSDSNSQEKNQEDFEIITTEKPKKKNNKRNKHKNNHDNKNKPSSKKPKNKNGKKKKDKKGKKKTTLGVFTIPTPVDEITTVNEEVTTEEFNQSTEPDDISMKSTFGWTESTEDYQTTIFDDTTTILYELGSELSEVDVDTVTNTPDDGTTSNPTRKTTTGFWSWFIGSGSNESDETNNSPASETKEPSSTGFFQRESDEYDDINTTSGSETTKIPETTDFFSPSTIKPCTSDDCNDLGTDVTSKINTESPSTIPHTSSSEYLVSMSSTAETTISTGAEKKDSDSMESSVSKEKRSRIDYKSQSPKSIIDSKEDDTIFWSTTISPTIYRLDIGMEAEISEEILRINENQNTSKQKPIEENFNTNVNEPTLRTLITLKPFGHQCRLHQHKCDGFRCIPMKNVCNGIVDCDDSTDETPCPLRFLRIKNRFNAERCREDQFACDNTLCLEQGNICDGVRHCNDGTDETDCQYWNAIKKDAEKKYNARYHEKSTTTVKKQVTTTSYPGFSTNQQNQCHPELEFKCHDGSCIEDYLICDGYKDCAYGEDEDRCSGFAPCPSMDFTCEDGSCIPKTKVCDGIDNCPRAEDELHCDRECTPTQFKCGSGRKCIEGIYRCDGHPDCPDQSDEDKCPGVSNENVTHTVTHTNAPPSRPWITERPGTSKECDPRTEMRCADGRQCILLRRKCDSVFDCFDNSDEADCGGCEQDEWKCASGECVTENARCDGKEHCPDGSDEIGCAECPAGTFQCNDGLCLDVKRLCDGRPHCRDGSDEINCQGPYCPDGQAPCDNGVCIDQKFLCDRNNDCLDGSDEARCPDTVPEPQTCARYQFTCRDGSCIPREAFCDGHHDCPDGDDEDCQRGIEASDKTSSGRHPENVQVFTDSTVALGVTGTETGPWSNQSAPRICTEGDFVCADGTCIPAAHRCDNFYDCRDFTDEQYCFECSSDQFQCGNGDCISNRQKCDGLLNCDDGSDEEGCEPETTPHSRYCSADQFTCVRDRNCVHYSSRCNGIPDCRDNSDEDGCDTEPKSGLDLKTRPSEQVIKENPAKQGREVVFQCRDEGSQRAKVRWLRGNGRPLPPGSRDINGRLEIPNIQMEHSGTYICEAVGYPSSTPGRQVTVQLEVEKLDLPVTRPPQVCKYDEATCSNGDCIPKSSVCNGKYDCTDGSDEMRCNPHGCEPNQFRCANKECVSKVWRCDGDKDCRDGTDEENCEPPPPGSPCRYDEYQCSKYEQCIPKSYHCDMERDCQDGSDEFGCSPVYITKPPPGMMTLHVGETMILTCSAIGVPIPEINWRLNWGHVPQKCYSTSQNGTGTLTCPDIQVSDQGAYSCEALNAQGFVFAVPDTILVVDREKGPCQPGTFNDEARTAEECISCFCFGVSNTCKSANLFTYQLRPPFDRFRVVSVESSPALRIMSEVSSQVAEVRPRGSYGADISAPYNRELTSYNVPYFAIPENFYGPSSLKSYGGYLKYTVSYNGNGRTNNSPDVILSGNGFVLFHRGSALQPNTQNDRQIRFFYGEWYKNDRGQDIRATREEIMMVLAKVDHILIKAKYEDSPELQVSITDIVMDTAEDTNVGLGAASYVEECTCPTGYYGYSCESCAPGFIRRTSGAWLGECYLPPQPNDTCKEGFYGDPLRNIPCERCACPLTNPANQFARTCHLGAGRNPVCDCLPEYSGPQCQYCADGYVGNPRIPGGGKCERKVQCNPDGSLTPDPDAEGKCRCKQYATGLLCDQCKANTFNLATKNQFGCIGCFCMGITDRCTSSHWYRNEIRVPFTNSIRNFTLVESNTPNAKPISEGIHLETTTREIVYSEFPNRGNADVYYWQLPNIFLGNQITSYGGDLRYTVRYVPSPGGQSSRNNAADVALISANGIDLHYYSRDTPESNTPQAFTVPLLEQYWQRIDGTQADREHLLMALADVKDIRIKATYTTHTDEAALSQVSLDIAEKYNTGKERAYEVEECSCPVGYRGLSCEDCAVGYTKATSEGFYLGICEPCSCNGHSSQCDPKTGICENCGNHTTGENCEICEPGYQGDATRGGCSWNGGGQPTTCDCDPAGSKNEQCLDGRCDCKENVEGARCNRCRQSTFGLSADNIDGCNVCYCSGVTNQCHESSLYIQPLPMWVYDSQHGFTLTDASRLDVIDDGFIINDELNEIGYRFSNNRNRRLFWSLPATFTGNKVKSYGGKLTITQHITARPNSQILKDQDVLLIGNGITLFWTNPQEILPGIPMTYSVLLRESEWRRLSTAGPRRASRTDLMTVLSNLDAILVRASHSEGMTATYISDISLDSATENRKTHRATQIEACRCPPGYSGTSCETCAPGYYRDLANRSVSVLGSCNACPCSNHEESCEISGSGQIRCNCRSGYGGRYCQDIAELRVGLMPIKPQAMKGSVVNFTCSYDHWATLYINLKLTEYYGHPLTAWKMIPGPLVTTNFGAQRVWTVFVGNDPCNVECTIVDGRGKELAKIATTISPVDDPEPQTTLPPPVPHPKIEVTIQEKKFQIVQTGSTVQLHCSGRSVDDAPLRIHWEKEGTSSLPDRSSDNYQGLLIIRDIRVSDSGIYVCRVTDGINIVFEKVSISVGGARPEAPRAMIRPSYLQVKEGEPVRFHCEATGHPEPEIEWVRVQGEMNPEARTYKGVWQIPAAIRSDAAQYKCIARNEVGMDEQTTVLYVSENPDGPNPDIIPSKPPTIRPTQWTGSAGDAVRLICARSNYHASVSWIRSGNLALPQSFSQQDGVLTIGNPIPIDSGIYICTASSFQGTETSTSANVTIYPKRTHPSVRVEPERQTVSQGTEAEIRCIADRDSGLQIKWVKYGEPSLGPNARQIGDTLNIMSPQVSDRGVYICRASNSAGSYEASAVVEVTPRETPILELHPRDSQIVNLGGSADIQCRVTAGIPMPEVHWNREDGRQFSSNIQQLPGGLLRLTNVSMHDGGSYRCSASNAVGSTSAIARIEVQSLPIITVTPSGGLIYAKRGARVMLTCTAEGLPQPTVAWMKSRPGVAIYSFARRPEASRLSAVHEIMSMSPDDEGSYTCQAINAAGVTEERVQIRIEEDNNVGEVDPQEPDYNGGVRIPNDSLSVPSGGTVTIRCQVYGPTNGPRIDIDWRRSDRRSLPAGSFVRDHSLTIENATREAAGEYVCLGIDTSGREIFRARAHVDVVSLPNIKLNPSRQTVRPGESPAIVCTATGDQPMTIEWEAIGRDLPYSVNKDRGVLQFNRITYTDAGKYVCKARNNAGIAEAVAEVLVSESTVEDPVIRAVDRDITTYLGSTVTLRCDVRPRSVIEWTKNGRPLSRNVRVGEDYVELTNVQPEDGGTYTCQVRTSHGQSNDYINLRVAEAQNPVVTIEPSQNVVNIGDMIDLRCAYTGTDSPRYHWTRPNHLTLPVNSLEHGNILRLSNIELSESGVYRCRVSTQGGNYDGEYNLIVQGGNDAPAIETKYVPYGKGLEMRCRPNLEEPVDYHWSKLGGLLPQDAEAYDNILKLTKVRSDDAGTYICKASNGQASTEVPTVLVVTGVVPNFHQAPKSWISLAPLADSYLKFTIEVSFKPENYDGIIFYNDETVDGTGDYIMLALDGGYPVFHFDLGSGAAVIRAAKPVSLGEWHTIKLLRNRKEGTMLVDGEGPYKAVNSGKKQGLDLKGPLYVGGVPDYNTINPQAHANTGFVGCISRLVLGDRSFDLIGEQTDSIGVTNCETCAENPCNNAGVCQEASMKNGYRCLCRAGYSGKHCDSIGQPCYPGACGDGQCVDKENEFECYCPHGKSGPRCELFTPNLNEPAFRDDRAYLAYPTPTMGRRLKLSMNFKPSDNGDGILMYCSQSEEGLGDFVALVIKDRYIEFRFDVGSGMAVIRSNHVVQPGTWTHVTLSRDLRDGRVSINGGQIFEGRSPGSARTMTLNTALYIGGIDRRKITINRNIGVDRNFHGCINELEMSAKNFGFRKSIIDSANVEDCSTFPIANFTRPEPTTQQPTKPPTTFYDPCERKPCINGVCHIVGLYDYSCTCDYGYVGRDCEKILKQCELMRPCQNGGSCMDQHGSYNCDCRLGFSGKDCEKKVDIIYDVAFRGDGWLELDRSVMPHEEENEVLCFEISTNKSNGLVMWHGQTPNDLSSDDYIALAIVDGYVEFQYDLGSGPAVMRVTAHRVDDGERHRIILKRKFSEGNIELDGEHMETGISYGLQQLLNARGSVYLGGVPDWAMTYGRYNDGFSGCIYAMEVQDSAGIDIGSKAIRGKNVEPCTRARWIPSSLIFTDGDSDGFDDFVPPPPVNIIHPKPTANLATTNIKNIYLLVAVQNTIGFSIDAKLHSIIRAVLSIAIVTLTKSYFE